MNNQDLQHGIDPNQAGFRRMLQRFELRNPEYSSQVEQMLELSRNWPQCLSRDNWDPGHFTASAWIVDPNTDMVLLTHHKKLNMWLQLGGHVEHERDIRAAALREACEESGLGPSEFSEADGEIFDIDIHQIPTQGSSAANGGGGAPAHGHFDIRVLLFADSRASIAASSESHSIRWVPLDDLEDFSREDSLLRMRSRYRSYGLPVYE